LEWNNNGKIEYGNGSEKELILKEERRDYGR